MPRVETRYYCDVCGKYYMKKESAVECEKSHLIPESVNGADYARMIERISIQIPY